MLLIVLFGFTLNATLATKILSWILHSSLHIKIMFEILYNFTFTSVSSLQYRAYDNGDIVRCVLLWPGLVLHLIALNRRECTELPFSD